MAKYNVDEARRVYNEMVEKGRTLDKLNKGDIDYALIDMLGYFLWSSVSEDERTDEMKQRVVFACLLSAYVAGRESLDEKEVASAFFKFVETLDIPEAVNDFDDLMGWDS
jgi:hypothetical protein